MDSVNYQNGINPVLQLLVLNQSLIAIFTNCCFFSFQYTMEEADSKTKMPMVVGLRYAQSNLRRLYLAGELDPRLRMVRGTHPTLRGLVRCTTLSTPPPPTPSPTCCQRGLGGGRVARLTPPALTNKQLRIKS